MGESSRKNWRAPAVWLIPAIFGLVCLFAPTAWGESVRVSSPRFHSFKEIKLRPGQNAEVSVYLTSAGDALVGFKVYLLKESTQSVVQTAFSNESGAALFEKVPAGRYIVVLEKTRVRNEEASATVVIGDFYVTAIKRETSGVRHNPE